MSTNNFVLLKKISGFLLEIEAQLIALMKDTKQITKTGIFIPEIFFQFQYANVQHTMGNFKLNILIFRFWLNAGQR